jgi:hypothetical protein
MAKAVVAEAPAAVVVDAPVAITAVMVDAVAAITAAMEYSPVAITAAMPATGFRLAVPGAVRAHAMDLARDHLPSITYRRPFTTILASVLIIAMILPVSTIPVIPSLQMNPDDTRTINPRSASNHKRILLLHQVSDKVSDTQSRALW